MRSICAPLLAAAVALAGTGVASAQPVDPYGDPTPPPPPAPAPSPADDAQRDLDEAVAAQLVVRAHELFEAKAYADAKQLLVEAMLEAPGGAAATEAKALLRQTNQRLGIAPDDGDPAAPPVVTAPAPVDPYYTAPPATALNVDDPEVPPPLRHDDDYPGAGRDALALHGATMGSLLFLSFVDLEPNDGSDSGGAALAAGLAGGLTGSLVGYYGGRRAEVTRASARTIGSGATWGAVTFGLFADIANLEGTTANEVVRTAAVGGVLGGLAGAAYAHQHVLSAGDVAVVDSLAAMGVAGGLTIGLTMAPPESEAYSLNAALGAAGGVLVGLIAAPRVDISQRRMLRIDLAAAAGFAAPWVLYAAAADDGTNNDEQVFGLLSTAGMVTGAYLGIRWTRHLDDGPSHVSDAPLALLRRSSEGGWSLGAPTLRAPTLPALAPPARGLAIDVLGARF